MQKWAKMAIATAVLLAVLISSTPSVILASTNDTPLIRRNTFANNGTINSSSCINFQDSTTPDKIKVIASFYPIFEFVKKVGEDRVEVSSLIPVGIEPHDYEPTIQQVQTQKQQTCLVFSNQ
jgi:ABC-type Zn uptake system ZnuABC Zn-binding protein ZnuA